MSGGFYILVWDGWAADLNMIAPQLLRIGTDSLGYPRYWSPEHLTDKQIAEKYNLTGHYRIIR